MTSALLYQQNCNKYYYRLKKSQTLKSILGQNDSTYTSTCIQKIVLSEVKHIDATGYLLYGLLQMNNENCSPILRSYQLQAIQV